MNQQIIYGSEYGTTRRYAEQLSQLTGIPAMDYTSAKNLDGCELVIYLGGLYAGGVKGLKHTVKRLPTGVKLILVTVGLADVTDQENIRNIQNSVRRQLPTALFDQTALFHLRGGIDYDGLFDLPFKKAPGGEEDSGGPRHDRHLQSKGRFCGLCFFGAGCERNSQTISEESTHEHRNGT